MGKQYIELQELSQLVATLTKIYKTAALDLEIELPDEYVTNAKISDGSVTSSKIEDNAVTGSKIEDNAVTGSKIADNIITTDKLMDNSITIDKLAFNVEDGGGGGSDNNSGSIEDGSVTTEKLADGAVTNSKLHHKSISLDKIDVDFLSAINEPFLFRSVFFNIDNENIQTYLKCNGLTINLNSLGPTSDWLLVDKGILAEETTNGHFIGTNVSLSANGRIMAFGSSFNDNTYLGDVIVYNIRDKWQQIGNKINGGDLGNNLATSGRTVSLSFDGKVIAIGGYDYGKNGFNGRVSLYGYDGILWKHLDSVNGVSDDSVFGFAVSINSDGTIVAVSDPLYSNSTGRVIVYNYTIDNGLSQYGSVLIGESTGDLFGISISISSDAATLIVGAMGYDNNKGAAYIYKFTEDWVDYRGDNLFIGENSVDEFGSSVDINADGTVFAVASRKSTVSTDDDIEPESGNSGGYVKTFVYSNGMWNPKGTTISSENEVASMSIDYKGDIIAIGYPFSGLGSVVVYRQQDDQTIQIGNQIDDMFLGLGIGTQEIDAEIGYDVVLSADGKTLGTSAPKYILNNNEEEDDPNDSSGAIFILTI